MAEAHVLRDNYGSKVVTGRTQDGECLVSITNGSTCVMAVFTDEGFAEFRELLDRAAMPGQAAASGQGTAMTECCACHAVLRWSEAEPAPHRRNAYRCRDARACWEGFKLRPRKRASRT